MNILARLASVEKVVKEKEVEVEESSPENTSTTVNNKYDGDDADEEEQEWVEVKRSPAKPIELNATPLKRVELSSLIWGKFTNLKGSSPMLPGRICDPCEAASDPLIAYPIPEGMILVEFFNLPSSLGRLFLLESKQIIPYNGHKTGDEWLPSNIERLTYFWKRRYNVFTGTRIVTAAMKTARSYLELARSKIEIDGEYDTSTDYAPIVETPVDASRFALRLVNPSDNVFVAGDWVQYQHGILKCTMRSRVISVEVGKRNPLGLENGESLDPDQLIIRIPAREAKDQGDNVTASVDNLCMPLKEFAFKSSRIKGVDSFEESMQRKAKHKKILQAPKPRSLDHSPKPLKERNTPSPSSSKDNSAKKRKLTT